MIRSSARHLLLFGIIAGLGCGWVLRAQRRGSGPPEAASWALRG